LSSAAGATAGKGLKFGSDTDHGTKQAEIAIATRQKQWHRMLSTATATNQWLLLSFSFPVWAKKWQSEATKRESYAFPSIPQTCPSHPENAKKQREIQLSREEVVKQADC
jgi:hypothetical protein